MSYNETKVTILCSKTVAAKFKQSRQYFRNTATMTLQFLFKAAYDSKFFFSHFIILKLKTTHCFVHFTDDFLKFLWLRKTLCCTFIYLQFFSFYLSSALPESYSNKTNREREQTLHDISRGVPVRKQLVTKLHTGVKLQSCIIAFSCWFRYIMNDWCNLQF